MTYFSWGPFNMCTFSSIDTNSKGANHELRPDAKTFEGKDIPEICSVKDKIASECIIKSGEIAGKIGDGFQITLPVTGPLIEQRQLNQGKEREN